MFSKHLFVLVLGGVLLSVGCATTSSHTPTKPAEESWSLPGAWELHADDEKPNGDISPEILFLYPNQQLLVQAKISYRGLYAHDQDTITMMVLHSGQEIHVPRKFTLDREGLHLANKTTGSAHYRRIETPFPQWAIDDDWKTTEYGHFTLRIPPTWNVRSEPPEPRGAQRLQATNPPNTKMLILMVLPNDGSINVEALIQGFGQQLIARTPDANMQLKKLDDPDFFGISGTVYGVDPTTPDAKMTIRLIGTMKGPSTSLMAIFVFDQDALGELKLMGESLKINLPE